MISFGIRSFTNLPVQGTIDAVRKELDRIGEIDLPVSKVVYVSLVCLFRCVYFRTPNLFFFYIKMVLAKGKPE